MKIKDIEIVHYEIVEMEDGGFYERYSSKVWREDNGDAYWTILNKERLEKLEEAYQEFKNKLK